MSAWQWRPKFGLEIGNLYLNLTSESSPVFIGLIEEIKAAKTGLVWTIWVKTRTGPNGVDYHRFKVAHDEFPQWVVEMFKAEENK